jgi:hypothetical protein
MRKPVIAACVMVLSIFFTCLTYYQPIIPLLPGIDASWAFALNYIHQHQLVMGRDILFTFGPLGFLEHIRGLDRNTVSQSAAFWFGISAITNSLILLLCLQDRKSHLSLLLNIFIGCLLIIFLNYNIDRLFVMLYIAAFLHWRTMQWRYLLSMVFVVIVCLLIKFSYGITSLALLLPYLCLIASQKKKMTQTAVATLALPLLYCLYWFACYGTMDGAMGYLLAGIEFSSGSASAMALNPENSGWAIGCFYAVFIFCTIATSKLETRTLLTPYICFLATGFVWSKYAFGREDASHLASLMTFVFYALLVWAIACRTTIIKLIPLASIALCFLAWQQMHSTSTGAAVFKPEPKVFSLTTFKKNRWDIDERLRKWEKASIRNLQPLVLPESMRSAIGHHTVDIYPWESLIVQANNLSWQPRPVFQNYITYTRALDNANQSFFNSSQAPDFIVWHYHDIADIDQRYPLNTDPLTQQAILEHYSIQICEAAFCLWKKSDTSQLKTEATRSSASTYWNTWTTVPDSQNDIVRAELATEHTLAGKINLLLWKEGGISIDYRLRDGSIKTHSLVLETATAGVWASPYLNRFDVVTQGAAINPDNLHSNVEAIRIRTSRPWAFDPDIHLTWTTSRFTASRPW